MAHNRRLSQFANTVGYDGGNIGIGTVNPNRLLHLKAASSTAYSGGSDTADYNLLKIENTTDDKSAGVFFLIGSNGEAAITATEVADGNTDIAFQNRGGGVRSEKVRITSDGNLGINRTDPNQRLNVSGNIEVNAYDNTGGGGGYNTSSGLIIGNLYDAGKSYSGSDDRTACIWQERGLDLDFATNNTLRMKITYDGLVGIGITNPDALLTIKGNSDEVSTPSIRLLDGTDTREVSITNSSGDFVASTHGTDNAIHGRIKIFESGIIDLDTGGASSTLTNRLRVTSAGKIQVTGTRGGTLQPSDDDTLELYTKATSGNASTGGGITFYNHHGGGHVMGGVIHVVKQNGTYENSQSDMLFGTRINGSSVAYRARLTSHGSWETYSSTVNIDIANSQSSGNNEAFIYARYGSNSLTAGSLSFRVYTNGNVQNTNNSYGSISDQNLKENIVDATSQWDDIKALQIRKYNFREATGHQTHTQLGLIAQEVETVSPGLVETTAVREGETCQDADGNQLESIKSINYSVLYMKAVKALQEAQTRIETLETRVSALENP